MSKKTLILCLCVVAALVVGLSTTLAYLTDSDTRVNTFTVGNVDITVEEEFEDGTPLYPGIETNKDALITNTGANDAWVWMTVAVPADVDDYVHLGWASGVQPLSDEGEIKTGEDGNEYAVYTVLVPEVLASGDSTGKILDAVVLDESVDYQDGQYVSVVGGVVTTINEDLSELDVIVTGYAVQTEGFNSVEEAYEAYGDQWGDIIPTTEDPIPEDINGDDDDVTFDTPANAYRVTSSAELKAAVAAGETALLLAPGEYDIDGCGSKTLTLVGEDRDATIIKIVGGGQGEANGQLDYGLDSSTVTFQNLTIESNNQTYAGYARLNGTYKDVDFINTYCLNGDSTFEYCTFDISGDQYSIWTWGAPNATFDHCTFNTDGKAILLYGTVSTDLTVSNTVFNDKGGLTDLKAAIEVGEGYGSSHTITVSNTDVNGYEINDNGINTGTTLWANKNSMSSDKLNVVVDGVDVY